MSNKNDDSYAVWLEESISNEYLNYYEYKYFTNIQPIGSGAFGKVSRANWKDTDTVFSLKTFDNHNSIFKEVVREVL